MIAAAKSFEADADRRIESVTNVLTPDAVHVLRMYGVLQKKNGPAQSLHLQIANQIFTHDPRRYEERFEQATRELLKQRLLLTEYKPNATPGSDMFGMHATKLGWIVIGRMWPDFAK